MKGDKRKGQSQVKSGRKEAAKGKKAKYVEPDNPSSEESSEESSQDSPNSDDSDDDSDIEGMLAYEEDGDDHNPIKKVGPPVGVRKLHRPHINIITQQGSSGLSPKSKQELAKSSSHRRKNTGKKANENPLEWISEAEESGSAESQAEHTIIESAETTPQVE